MNRMRKDFADVVAHENGIGLCPFCKGEEVTCQNMEPEGVSRDGFIDMQVPFSCSKCHHCWVTGFLTRVADGVDAGIDVKVYGVYDYENQKGYVG